MIELELARQKLNENKTFFKKIGKNKKKELDKIALAAHEKAFNNFDCLSCANCCKTTGPLFTKSDIDKLAKLFRIKSSEFISTYLRIDEDNDYVLRTTPCTFLMDDNKCFVYDHRPKACREFPHTNRKNFYQIRELTIKNTLICPIAYNVVEDCKINLKP